MFPYTTFDYNSLAVSLLAKGIAGYLVKPVEKAVLVQKVDEILAQPHDFQN